MAKQLITTYIKKGVKEVSTTYERIKMIEEELKKMEDN